MQKLSFLPFLRGEIEGLKWQNMILAARRLCSNMTQAEKSMWSALRRYGLGVRFNRQYVFNDKYVIDFYCAQKKLVVEIDGGQHYENAADRERDSYLERHGCSVLRFWNNDVLNNLSGCLEVIEKKLKDL